MLYVLLTTHIHRQVYCTSELVTLTDLVSTQCLPFLADWLCICRGEWDCLPVRQWHDNITSCKFVQMIPSLHYCSSGRWLFRRCAFQHIKVDICYRKCYGGRWAPHLLYLIHLTEILYQPSWSLVYMPCTSNLGKSSSSSFRYTLLSQSPVSWLQASRVEPIDWVR